MLKKIMERVRKRPRTDTAAPSDPPNTPPQAQSAHPTPEIQSPLPSVPFEESDALPTTSPDVHHHISNSVRQRENIYKWVHHHEEQDDQAINVLYFKFYAVPMMLKRNTQDFIPNLKDHILARILGRAYDGDEVSFSDDERDSIQICDNYFYRHKVLRVNYTSYDLRRCQDSINPRTHPDIMLLSHDDEPHPYWYARVIGIFHVNVFHKGPNSTSPDKKRVDFLWIRWFGRDLNYRAGWKARRLHRVGFLDAERPGAFGFLDPAVVIRGVHMIPSYAHGTTEEYLSPPRSVARLPLDEVSDWQYYYVGM